MRNAYGHTGTVAARTLHPNLALFNEKRGRPLFLCIYIYHSGNLFRTSPAYFLSHLSGLNFNMSRKPSDFQRDEKILTHLLRERCWRRVDTSIKGDSVYKDGERATELVSNTVCYNPYWIRHPFLTQRYKYHIITGQSSSDIIAVYRVAVDKDVKILLPTVYQMYSFTFLPLHPWKTQILRVNWKDGDSSLWDIPNGKGEQGTFLGMWVYTGYEFPRDIITNYHRLYSRQYTIVLYNPGGQKSESASVG